MPWKNGRGRTAEIHVHPAGAGLAGLDWRASLADVEDDGPFSSFAGIDRTLVLLEGNGIRLSGDGVDVALRAAFDTCEFSGDTAIRGTLIDGPVRDFNLMLRRDRIRGGITIVRRLPAFIPAARFVLCYAAAGTQHCELDGQTPIELSQGHALLVEGDEGEPGLVVRPATSAAAALVATMDPR